MNDFPIDDILFIIKVVQEKSYVQNLAAFIKSVVTVANYAATRLHLNGPKPQPEPEPNPPVAMSADLSDEDACAALQSCADNPEGGIPTFLVMWLTKLLLGLM